MLLCLSGCLDYLSDGAPFGDDCSAHLALAVHLSELFASGETNLFWGNTNLGLPLFAAYQPLSSMLTAALMMLTKGWLDPIFLFKLLVVLLWALLPLSWYIGARWLGLNRRTSLYLGLLILAPRDLLNVGVGLTTVAHHGLLTQLWGMHCMPLALGLLKKCFFERNVHPISAGLVLALTAATHLFVGFMVGLIMVITLIVHRNLLRRESGRLLIVGGTALVLLAWWLIPLFMTGEFRGGLPWRTQEYSGWSATRLVQTFLGGDVFDHERFPWLTLLVIVAFLRQLARVKVSKSAQCLGMFGLLSAILAGGESMWGAFYSELPMHRDVNPSRYLLGIQLAGLVATAMWLSTLRLRDKPTVNMVCLTVVIALFGIDRRAHASSVLRTFNHTDPALAAVAKHLAKSKQHRFAVDYDLNTTSHFFRDLLPMLAQRAQLQSYAMGYHATHSTFYAEYIQYTSSWMRLFNIGELVARNDGGPLKKNFPVTFRAPPYTVFGVPGSSRWGYFEVVRKGPAVRGDLRTIRPVVKQLYPTAFEKGFVLPLLKQRDSSAPQSPSDILNQLSTATVPTRKGTVISQRFTATSFAATVKSASNEWLLLKVNYFPFWTATVDGLAVDIVHVAPNFMAIPLTPGQSNVVFRYQNPTWQKCLAALSMLFILVWTSIRLHVRFRRFRQRDAI